MRRSSADANDHADNAHAVCCPVPCCDLRCALLVIGRTIGGNGVRVCGDPRMGVMGWEQAVRLCLSVCLSVVSLSLSALMALML
eukprot:SAG31_NODE_1731_length_7420_cov_12.646914_1_plen_84_part_00